MRKWADRAILAREGAGMTTPTDRIIADLTIPAGGHWGRVLRAGQVLRIIDLEGKQAVDFLCYNAGDPDERYNAADTMKYAGTLFLTTGHGIYSGMGRRLLTIVADTCGRHDTIGGCCSAESNELRYGVKDSPSCRQNFLRALEPFGLGKKDIVANLNWFMNVPVGPDGAMAIVEGISKPGDHVDLRAEMDVLAVISNCPQTRNPCNGFQPTPIRVIVRE
jgi:urea carboxylase-associated protein 1